MAYFLGRDVAVYITTESTVAAESINITAAMAGQSEAAAAAEAGLLVAQAMSTVETSTYTSVAD